MGAETEVFPAWTEADWRKAAEAALKGASLDKLVTRTADGLRIEPVYLPAEGPRALRAGRTLAGDRPPRQSRRPRGQRPGARRSRQRGRRPSGRVRGRDRRLRLRPRRSDPEALAAAFDGVQFDAGARFELDLGPNGPAEALAFADHVRGAGAEPSITPSRSASTRSRPPPAAPFRPTGRLTSNPSSMPR